MSVSKEEDRSLSVCKSKFLYEIWPGNQRFCYEGRLMHGPVIDRKFCISAYGILTLLPLTEFLITAKYLWWHVTPLLVCVALYLWVGSIIFALLVTFSDPGIIPRRWVFLKYGEVPKNYTSDALLEICSNACMPKFCNTCEIYRPKHAHHCSLCETCVEYFDHHCKYLNNCVGGRNYCFFVVLVIHLATLGIVLIANLCLLLHHDEDSPDYKDRVPFKLHEDSAVIAIAVVLLVMTILTFLPVVFLSLFHMILMCTGKTTRDFYKQKAVKLKKVYCKRPPSLFSPRLIVSAAINTQDAFIEASGSEISI